MKDKNDWETWRRYIIRHTACTRVLVSVLCAFVGNTSGETHWFVIWKEVEKSSTFFPIPSRKRGATKKFEHKYMRAAHIHTRSLLIQPFPISFNWFRTHEKEFERSVFFSSLVFDIFIYIYRTYTYIFVPFFPILYSLIIVCTISWNVAFVFEWLNHSRGVSIFVSVVWRPQSVFCAH